MEVGLGATLKLFPSYLEDGSAPSLELLCMRISPWFQFSLAAAPCFCTVLLRFPCFENAYELAIAISGFQVPPVCLVLIQHLSSLQLASACRTDRLCCMNIGSTWNAPTPFESSYATR